jgi:hypothetical protein
VPAVPRPRRTRYPERAWHLAPVNGNLDDTSVAEAVTATGYDAAGHAVQRITLGGVR